MRRSFLSCILFMIVVCTRSQTILPLYPDTIPNSRPVTNLEKVEYRNGIQIISNVSVPTLSVYLPERKKTPTAAVIICPGGGYHVLAASHEGSDVAEQFVAMGVAAIVLKYRIPSDRTMIDRSIGPLQDAQQAIRMVREHAKEWNIDPAKTGIMGFSAGGHLAASAGTHFNTSFITNPANVSLRPDFMILIYPVISFLDSIRHNGSMEQLIGKDPLPAKKEYYSNELQVSHSTPRTFLVHASDDDLVIPANSLFFYSALLRHRVKAELHMYQEGGHGFGLNMKNKNEKWMERCRHWLENSGWLSK
jgi:acetyl esterase/lipase